MSSTKLGYTSYQARTQWYMNHWGSPESVRGALMEDGRTKLGIMRFAPASTSDRRHWTFGTNGMSERRMPCVAWPHGDPSHRLELIAYANNPCDWISDLLVELAHYPFLHQSVLAVGHTLPVSQKTGNLWSGYLLARPRFEPEEFNPLAIEIGFGSDWVFYAELLGLKADELRVAIEIGGSEFFHKFVAGRRDSLLLDVERNSLLASEK
ncbi:MAG TPA: suppressor of fused domain protein [Verrucomicrobiae bacterium]|nr:suppressor of fused domain protein [Verrucomicrobiae bacterium]